MDDDCWFAQFYNNGGPDRLVFFTDEWALRQSIEMTWKHDRHNVMVRRLPNGWYQVSTSVGGHILLHARRVTTIPVHANPTLI